MGVRVDDPREDELPVGVNRPLTGQSRPNRADGTTVDPHVGRGHRPRRDDRPSSNDEIVHWNLRISLPKGVLENRPGCMIALPNPLYNLVGGQED